MQKGSVLTYYADRGFGFIKPDTGGPNLFFHVRDCANGVAPEQGDDVTFEIGEGRNGRPCATGIRAVRSGMRAFG
jgi:cold shock protein